MALSSSNDRVEDAGGCESDAPPAFVCTVYGNAQPAGSKTPGIRNDGSRFVRDANPKSSEWKDHVRQVAGEQFEGPILEGPVMLSVYFYRPRPKGHYGTGRNAGVLKASAPFHPTTRPDGTKLIRGVEDALTGIVWRDDAQVIAGLSVKLYGEPARAVIRVEALTEAEYVEPAQQEQDS